MTHQIQCNNKVALLPISSLRQIRYQDCIHARKPACSDIISPSFYGYQISASSYCVRVVVFLGHRTDVNMALDGVCGQCHAPATLHSGKTPYQLRRRLVGPKDRSGRVQENDRSVTRSGRFNHPEKSLRKPMRMRLCRPQSHSGRLGEERSLLLLPECRFGRAGRSGVRTLTGARDYSLLQNLHTGSAPIQPPSQ